MGLKAYESTSFTLRGCRVPVANLLGGEGHYAARAGFKGALASFNATRPMIAAMAVGIGRAALDAPLAFAQEPHRPRAGAGAGRPTARPPKPPRAERAEAPHGAAPRPAGGLARRSPAPEPRRGVDGEGGGAGRGVRGREP